MTKFNKKHQCISSNTSYHSQFNSSTEVYRRLTADRAPRQSRDQVNRLARPIDCQLAVTVPYHYLASFRTYSHYKF